MYSACAGTSSATVSPRTSSTGFWRRKPAIRYSSTRVARDDGGEGGGGVGADGDRHFHAIALDAGDASAAEMGAAVAEAGAAGSEGHEVDLRLRVGPEAARQAVAECSAAFFWRCQCMPVVCLS